MRMSTEIQRVFCGFWNLRGFRLPQSGFVGAVIFVIVAAPPSNAVAQFPGVGSEAPSGVATTASVDANSDSGYADMSVSDTGISDVVGNASNDANDLSNQSNYDDGSSGDRLSDSGSSTVNLKKEHHRKHLFIQKLRFEFAAIELVERRTGLPFSRSDVPRYLDELRSDLKMMVNGAETGKNTDGALKSIARDAYLIETHLDDHLDQLLEQAGQPVPTKPFFAIEPAAVSALIL